VELFGTMTPEIPVWDIESKVNTTTGQSTKRKVLKVDFSEPFKRYDVMSTLGLDPLDLEASKMPKLRGKMQAMLFESGFGKKEYISTLNDK